MNKNRDHSGNLSKSPSSSLSTSPYFFYFFSFLLLLLLFLLLFFYFFSFYFSSLLSSLSSSLFISFLLPSILPPLPSLDFSFLPSLTNLNLVHSNSLIWKRKDPKKNLCMFYKNGSASTLS